MNNNDRPLFKPFDESAVETGRSAAYAEMTQRHFQELMLTGDVWSSYLDLLKAKFKDYEENAADGFPPDQNDPGESLYVSLTAEEIESRIKGDGILVVTTTTFPGWVGGDRLYNLVQLDNEGDFIPMTDVIAVGTDGQAEGSFTPDQAELIIRLGEEALSFLRTQ